MTRRGFRIDAISISLKSLSKIINCLVDGNRSNTSPILMITLGMHVAIYDDFLLQCAKYI